MFTGIIETTAVVKQMLGHRLEIHSPWDEQAIANGQSIAVQGCCLTVVERSNRILTFEVSKETFDKTNFSSLRAGQEVNLERAMMPNGRLDGHFVTGHVDTAGRIERIEEIGPASTRIEIGGLEDFQSLTIPKGSVAINGISLTINQKNQSGFFVNIIPYTFNHTSLKHASKGDLVNIEFDMMGKYILNYLKNLEKAGIAHVSQN